MNTPALPPVSALPVPAPRSFEELVQHGIPTALAGHDGTNRNRTGVLQISANTDIDAIRVFLAEYDNRPATHRAYRKELQRFYYWVVSVAGKPMSSLRREDLDGYRAFMAAPPASWCGPRNARRATEAWRPFEGPLSARSQAYAMVVIKNLFTYLCDMQYLAGNPLRAARKKPDAPYPKTGDLPKFLALDTLERLLAALEQECTRLDGLGDEHAEMERMLFVARFLANTGLRRAELANAQLRHLFRNREIVRGIDRWFLTVTGKGNKTARVPINDTAHGALRRYLAVLGLDPLRADPNTPLVLRAGASGRHAADSEPMTDQTIYEIVKQALAVGAAILQADYPSDARILREATPHWFRHTFATLMSQKGHPLPVIRLCLRHASIATTAIYTHAEDEETYDAVSTLKL